MDLCNFFKCFRWQTIKHTLHSPPEPQRGERLGGEWGMLRRGFLLGKNYSSHSLCWAPLWVSAPSKVLQDRRNFGYLAIELLEIARPWMWADCWGYKIQSLPGASLSLHFFSCSVANMHEPWWQEKGSGEIREHRRQVGRWGYRVYTDADDLWTQLCFSIGALKRERSHPRHCSLSRWSSLL